MSKTLYVSDLDGTLLNSNQRLSAYTIQTINDLVARGMIFSYATARSVITASSVSKGISPEIPVIVYNGAFILENGTGKVLHANFFGGKHAAYIYALLQKNGVAPIVYAYIDGVERFTFCEREVSAGAAAFLQTRRDDIRWRTGEGETLLDGDVFYFTCIDSEEKLAPLYDVLKEKFHCVFGRDIYSGEFWLEILPKEATKAHAVGVLKNMMGCDRVVVFGDGRNDASMFRVADACYAVENAEESLKAIATAVIDGNNADGVAKWLKANYKPES